jgi:hypothetical protein
LRRSETFAVLGVVINAVDDAGAAAGANGLNVTLDAQLVADIKAIAAAVKANVAHCGGTCKQVVVSGATPTHTARSGTR